VLKTLEGKWVLWKVDTKEQVEHWPVDARLLLMNGSHTQEAPDGVEPQLRPEPPRHVGVPRAPVATIFEAPEPEAEPRAPVATIFEAPEPEAEPAPAKKKKSE
jgi:hypothetical protein